MQIILREKLELPLHLASVEWLADIKLKNRPLNYCISSKMSKGLEEFKPWALLKVTKGLKINRTNLMALSE